MNTVNVQEAKTRLSELLRRVESGEHIIIARAGRAIARLEPVEPVRRSLSVPLLGSLPPIDAAELLRPLPEEELREWEDNQRGDPLAEGPA